MTITVFLSNRSKCILSACDITLIYSFSHITGKPGKILNRDYYREKKKKNTDFKIMSGAKRRKQRGRERQMKTREKVKDAFA